MTSFSFKILDRWEPITITMIFLGVEPKTSIASSIDMRHWDRRGGGGGGGGVDPYRDLWVKMRSLLIPM